MVLYNDLIKEMQSLSSKDQAENLSRFFKTGKGQYGEGDIFLGIKVPVQRNLSKKYKDLKINDVEKLLKSKIHEHRLTALFILIFQYNIYKKEKNQQKIQEIVNFYLKHKKYVNNWDLVDLSAPKILGDYLLHKKRDILYKLAKSNSLWDKRIAIISTFSFIRNNDFKDCLKLSKLFLNEKHDLMHKAVGWMLREMGKRDINVLYKFLDENYKIMPRTMLRYAIEKFDENKRKYYMKKF
jgi:3-methyladenine DNA glycosylase AlkD